jgi:hypothetical protein
VFVKFQSVWFKTRISESVALIPAQTWTDPEDDRGSLKILFSTQQLMWCDFPLTYAKSEYIEVFILYAAESDTLMQ